MTDVCRGRLRVAGRRRWKRGAADGELAINRWSSATVAVATACGQQAGLARQPGQDEGVWHEQPRATSSSMRRPETYLVWTSLCLCKAGGERAGRGRLCRASSVVGGRTSARHADMGNENKNGSSAAIQWWWYWPRSLCRWWLVAGRGWAREEARFDFGVLGRPTDRLTG